MVGFGQISAPILEAILGGPRQKTSRRFLEGGSENFRGQFVGSLKCVVEVRTQNERGAPTILFLSIPRNEII